MFDISESELHFIILHQPFSWLQQKFAQEAQLRKWIKLFAAQNICCCIDREDGRRATCLNRQIRRWNTVVLTSDNPVTFVTSLLVTKSSILFARFYFDYTYEMPMKQWTVSCLRLLLLLLLWLLLLLPLLLTDRHLAVPRYSADRGNTSRCPDRREHNCQQDPALHSTDTC